MMIHITRERFWALSCYHVVEDEEEMHSYSDNEHRHPTRIENTRPFSIYGRRFRLSRVLGAQGSR